MFIEVINAGTFTHKQKRTQSPWNDFIGLSVAGLLHHGLYFPSGKKICSGQSPMLTIVPKDFLVDFEYSQHRENHVIIGKIHGLIWSEDRNYLEITDHGITVQMPYCVPLSYEKCVELRPRFMRITELCDTGLPADLFAARQHTAAILAEFIKASRPADSADTTAAEKFKHAIDNDQNFQKTLAELSRECGYSPGHLRNLFVLQYDIDPGEYRARRRLNRILELIRENTLSFKEIAEEVGMHHVTHLHVFLRERLGMTPRGLRGSSEPVAPFSP